MEYLNHILEIAITTISGLIVWIWKKMHNIEAKTIQLELKIAENYVTRPELKALEDKVDKHSEILGTKIDKVNDNLLLILHKHLDK